MAEPGAKPATNRHQQPTTQQPRKKKQNTHRPTKPTRTDDSNQPRLARLPRDPAQSDRPRAQHPRRSVGGACEHGGGGKAERRAGARGRRPPTETRAATSRPDKREHPGAPTNHSNRDGLGSTWKHPSPTAAAFSAKYLSIEHPNRLTHHSSR